MKSLLVGYCLFLALFAGALSQRISDFEPSGRRGDVLSLGDVSDQTIFNVDNSGGGSSEPRRNLVPGGNVLPGGNIVPGGNTVPGGIDGLDCAKINRECQCKRVPKPGPSPTGQYQMDYSSY